ncbi:hypothetical protein H0R92_03015 [Treponema sp. OMZ 840]|uniref:hypothetical protein n=1 Tax=Treponema sp. OMZ 840 TaxID=244313 RepID=UPI003D9064A4
MKKLCVWCISLCSILFLACNFGIKKDFAAVQIDFGASSPLERALDSNSLPVLSSAYIKIEAEGALSGYSITELPPQAPKNVSLNLPVGDTVRIKVSAYNPSGIWSGFVTHRVEEGANAVSVKLNKKISGLNKLLFTQTKVGAALYTYDLTLYMDGKSVNVPQSIAGRHIFARDSLGRLYVGYKSPSDKIGRYTSEGDGPESISVPSGFAGHSAFMNDFTKGEFYVVTQNGSVHKAAGNSVDPSPVANLSHFKGSAAIDNNRIAWIGKTAFNPPKIYVKTIDSTVESSIEIQNDMNIRGCQDSEVTDLFMRGDYAYVLFKTGYKVGNHTFYAFGGVVRYNINDLGENPVKIGFTDPSINTHSHILETSYDYSKNFYGAVKVIGFDEDNIYIADDGFDAEFGFDPDGHLSFDFEDRNRIAALNIRTNSVSFTDTDSAEWYTEWDD